MADRPVFVFVGAYDSKEGAEADYEVVKELHEAGALAAARGRHRSAIAGFLASTAAGVLAFTAFFANSLN